VRSTRNQGDKTFISKMIASNEFSARSNETSQRSIINKIRESSHFRSDYNKTTDLSSGLAEPALTTPRRQQQLMSLDRHKKSSKALQDSFNYTFDSRYSKNISISSPRVELTSYNVPSKFSS
jgi:hypothetical protein